jgi:hypothetical protein
MMAMLKTGAFCGALVLGMMVTVCVGEQPTVPPVVPSPAPVAPNPFALAYYGYGYPRLGYTPYQVPYFALHPPVYYSYPVPRPYGYSPFAYPPGVMTPEISAPGPVIIQNKFVPQKSIKAAGRDRVAQTPLRITNPYVVQSDSNPVASKVTAKAPRGPQVIYPMAVAGEAR